MRWDPGIIRNTDGYLAVAPASGTPYEFCLSSWIAPAVTYIAPGRGTILPVAEPELEIDIEFTDPVRVIAGKYIYLKCTPDAYIGNPSVYDSRSNSQKA